MHKLWVMRESEHRAYWKHPSAENTYVYACDCSYENINMCQKIFNALIIRTQRTHRLSRYVPHFGIVFKYTVENTNFVENFKYDVRSNMAYSFTSSCLIFLSVFLKIRSLNFMVFMIERATAEAWKGKWAKFHFEIHLVLSCCSLLLWFLFHNNLYRMNFKWNLNLFNEEEGKKERERRAFNWTLSW